MLDTGAFRMPPLSSSRVDNDGTALIKEWIQNLDPTTAITHPQTQSVFQSQTQLFQAFPNPFNSLTTIQFGLTTTGYVSLRIYDIRGRCVTRLIDKEMTTGSYTVSWDASQCASGLYFYRLSINNRNMCRKIMLLR
jgi:hypothetical protein